MEPSKDRLESGESQSGAEQGIKHPAPGNPAPLTFFDHTGKRFILPLKSCKTWASFKQLLEQIYARAKDDIRYTVQEDKYDLMTIKDEIIIPSVWEDVISDYTTLQRQRESFGPIIKIRLWSTPQLSSEHGPFNIPEQSPEIEHENTRGRRRSRSASAAASLAEPPRPKSGFGGEMKTPSSSRSRSRRQIRSMDYPQAITRYRSANRTRPVRSRSRSLSEWQSSGSRPNRRTKDAKAVSPGPTASEDVSYHDMTWSSSSGTSGDSEVVTVTEEDDEEIRPVSPLPPPRAVLPPMDQEGNRISLPINPSWSTHKDALPIRDDLEKTDNTQGMKTENLSILKAVQASSENRMSIQVHTLTATGAEISSSSLDINIPWRHLHASHLSFVQFKEACLDACSSIQGLSERFQRLVAKTLEKIENDKLKVYLDGMFIEPGTVLRGDETGREDDALSIIFACVPYLDIQTPIKSVSGQTVRLHPPRTLMQSFYPYESVQDRDREQVFRKLGNSTDKIIYVPTLWIMNIGVHAVVTCGYQSLAQEFVKSITLIQEPKSNMPLNIRCTDWEGHVFLYKLDECRTYFGMEQKLREIMYYSKRPRNDNLDLFWIQPDQKKRVSPANWQSILSTRGSMFIDLITLDKEKIKGLAEDESDQNLKPKTLLDESVSLSAVPPFFEWPHAEKQDGTGETAHNYTSSRARSEGDSSEKAAIAKQLDSNLVETKRSTHCLEVVEKAILSETLDEWDATTAVEETFTSDAYYRSLPERTLDDVKTHYISLLQSRVNLGLGTAQRTYHQVIVDEQCSTLTTHAAGLVEVVHETLKLFVTDVDKSTVLRKVWGAMQNLAIIVDKVCSRGPCELDPEEYTNLDRRPHAMQRTWSVRYPRQSKRGLTSKVPDDKGLNTSISKCEECRYNRAYSDPNAALKHLRKHAQSTSQIATSNNVSSNTDEHLETQETDLQNWVKSSKQAKRERLNAGFITLVMQATDEAKQILAETKDLAEGVKQGDGRLSPLYTLPHELLKTLRRLVVFYLAVERAFHHTEAIVDKKTKVDRKDVPFRKQGLEVLQRFSKDVKTSLRSARKDLCYMARSTNPDDLAGRLSLSAEYLCSWLIRRLLVRPVDNSMTVTDIYREYFSKLQFQVNHHPSKRLLRAINLLQEELSALGQVTTWQTNLIYSYTQVLDYATYNNFNQHRNAYFPIENSLLNSSMDSLIDTREDFEELKRRLGPLSESAKQSTEINDEDHGKAIFVFTVITAIFLPLSFVTSYLGMNTADIRDMDNKQSLFWEIAVPLTVVTMGSIIFIAYNGDESRETISSIYRRIIGKQDTRTAGGGISVAQRKRASKLPTAISSDASTLADEAEFVPPRSYWTSMPMHNLEEVQVVNYRDAETSNKLYMGEPQQYTHDTRPVHTRMERSAFRDQYNISGLGAPTAALRPEPYLPHPVYYGGLRGPAPLASDRLRRPVSPRRLTQPRVVERPPQMERMRDDEKIRDDEKMAEYAWVRKRRRNRDYR